MKAFIIISVPKDISPSQKLKNKLVDTENHIRLFFNLLETCEYARELMSEEPIKAVVHEIEATTIRVYDPVTEQVIKDIEKTAKKASNFNYIERGAPTPHSSSIRQNFGPE